MNATNGQKDTINFFCATCGGILRGPDRNGIACSSCLTRIPIRVSEHEQSSDLLTNGKNFKFLCTHCEQSFSSPVGFAGKHFNCPVCSRENVVPRQHSMTPPQEHPSAIPDSRPESQRDDFLPEFELEPSTDNPAREQFQQLLLLNETDTAVPSMSCRKEAIEVEPPAKPGPEEPDQPPLPTPDRCHGGSKAQQSEPVDIQPIRIAHPLSGRDRTILPQGGLKKNPNGIIPLRLGEEDTALPPPEVSQPGPIARSASEPPANPGREGDAHDPFFGDDIDIEKIFPAAKTQV